MTPKVEKVYRSLERIRAELSQNIDSTFVAEYYYRRVNILPPNAHLETEEKLRNISKDSCTEVVRIAASDAPTAFKRLNLKATIIIDGQAPFPASITHTAAEDGQAFRITLGFRGRVIKPGGAVTIRWQFVIPGSVMKDDEYWVFPFIFQSPAQSRRLEIAFERDPADVRLFRDDFDVSTNEQHLEPIPLTQPSITSEQNPPVLYRVDFNEDAATYLFTFDMKTDGAGDAATPRKGRDDAAPGKREHGPDDGKNQKPNRKKPPDDPTMTDLTSLNPWTLLMQGVKAVPALRYAVGFVGLVAAAAIARQLVSTPADAVIGVVAVFIMMVLLRIFAALAVKAAQIIRPLAYAAIVLAWSMLILFVGSLFLLVTSIFFEFPKAYPVLVAQFKPSSVLNLSVTVVDGDGRVVAGARIAARGRLYRVDRISDAAGSAVFEGVPSTDSELTISGAATGFADNSISVNVATSGNARIELASIPTPVTAPSQVVTNQLPSKPEQRAPRVDFRTELRGTWEIVVAGDIANVRVRRGTFQFTPQSDGEVLVTANFIVDGMDARVNGQATVEGSRVFATFTANNTEGGSWAGRATFERSAANQLSGRLRAKNGDDVSVQLRKLR